MQNLLNTLDPTNGLWWGSLVLLVLVAPVIEEFFLRGGLHQALTKGMGGKIKPTEPGLIAGWLSSLCAHTSKALVTRVALVALVFSAMHLHRSVVLALAILPAGMLIGWVFEKTRSWRKCALTHSALNALWLGAAFVSGPALADAWNGKTLYSTVPAGAKSCANNACHGVNPALRLNKILNGANNASLIRSAISGNTGGMNILVGKWTTTEIDDIALYLGNLNVTAPPPPPTGTAIATISAATVTFPASNVGVPATAQSLNLTNTGTASLTGITGISLSGANIGDFSTSWSSGTCATGTLAQAANCSIAVNFTPQAAGARSASLSFTHSVGTSTVTLSGTGAAAAASISPGSLAFSSTIINNAAATQQVTLTNTGNASMTINSLVLGGANAGDFSASGAGACAGGTLVANSSCTITVGFTPLVLNTRTASLTVNHSIGSSSVALSGTGVAAPTSTISLNQNLLSFGAITQNTTSAAPLSVTVSNTGQAPLVLSGISVTGVAAGIYTTGGTCAVNSAIVVSGTCTVSVNFTPNAIASFNGGLVLTSNASNGTVSVTLQGSGTAVPAPILSVGPSSLAFGSQTLNVAGATQFITLQNTGNAPANLSTINLTGSAMFAATNAGACGNAIAAGSSCTLGFRFTPTAASAQSATLQVLSNALGSPHQVALSGTGTALPTPSPALSQSALYAFTGTTVGQTNGTSLTATASNGGTAAYRVQSVSLSGTHISDFVLSGTCVANLSISPGNTCTVIVSFKPGNTGLLTARVNLLTDGGTTLGFDVDGTGTAVATTSAQLSSSNIALGTVLVGNVSAISKTTLSNTGNQNLTVNSISIAMPFSLATGTCLATPFVLAPGVACDIAIKFAPATATASSITLAVTTAAPGPSLQATVTGIGTLAPVTSGKLTSALDLGSILVGGSSAVLKSTLQNDGNQNLMVTSVNVAAPFALATGTCAAAPFTLAPGGTCDFGLSFTPNTAAPYSAALIVNTAAPGPTMQTTLTGLGTAPPAVNGGTSITGGATTTAGATTGTGAGMTTATTPTDTSTTATSTTGTAAAAPKATDPVTSTPTNIGAGGCTMSRDGNDASMLLLLLAALLTGWWRGSFSPKRSVER